MAARKTKQQQQTDVPATRYRVQIPGFSGDHPVGVKFIDGVGFTDDVAAVENSRDQGFLVTEVPADADAGDEPPAA